MSPYINGQQMTFSIATEMMTGGT